MSCGWPTIQRVGTLNADFAFRLAKLDASLNRERHAALRFYISYRTVCRRDNPLVVREIFQSPDVCIGRVAHHDGRRAGEIVEPVVIGVMRKELSIVVEHHDLSSDADAWRQDKLNGARPA